MLKVFFLYRKEIKENIVTLTKKEYILYLNKMALDYEILLNENVKKLHFGKFFFQKRTYFYTIKNVVQSIRNYHENQISFYGQHIENMVFFSCFNK